MVMHARKTPRMSDGYFEKHQAHTYQNSKYGSSKSYNSNSEKYEKVHDSPNGNYRSDSPDSQSPRERDRSYQSKGSYLQKLREKERENRDYKVREKYSDCVRSPKDKRAREMENRTSNERIDDKNSLASSKGIQNALLKDRKAVNNSSDKRDERERIARVGDWSEHLSSSGKKYYYNCKTEVSQWEKPREWIDRDRERDRNKDRDRDRIRCRDKDRDRDRGKDRDRGRDRDLEHSRSSTSYKHSNYRSVANSGREGASHWSSSGSSRDDSDGLSKDGRSKVTDDGGGGGGGGGQNTQDMDISPDDSTPTSSETSYGHQQHLSTAAAAASSKTSSSAYHHTTNSLLHPRLLAATDGAVHPNSRAMPATITSSNAPGPPPSTATSCTNAVASAHHGEQQQQQQRYANLVPASDCGEKHYHVGNSAAHHHNQHHHNQQQHHHHHHHHHQLQSSMRQLITDGNCEPITVETNNHHNSQAAGFDGPPTPTHSETLDCTKSLTVSSSSTSSANLPTLQGMSSSLHGLRAQGHMITPSLVNFYREDLLSHVRGWPAEIVEKQANKTADEAYIMSSIQCSKVSAELKTARSIVRLTEIQATLQEQRILFLRQQIKELEELKSQNSFMSDDT